MKYILAAIAGAGIALTALIVVAVVLGKGLERIVSGMGSALAGVTKGYGEVVKDLVTPPPEPQSARGSIPFGEPPAAESGNGFKPPWEMWGAEADEALLDEQERELDVKPSE